MPNATSSSGGYNAISFAEKLSRVHEHWSPRVIAEMNEYQFKVVKILGDFIWHAHKDTDEAFIVLDGILRIDLEDGHVLVHASEMFVVARGVQHKTFAEHQTSLLLIEPRGIVNTGDEPSDRAARNDVWV